MLLYNNLFSFISQCEFNFVQLIVVVKLWFPYNDVYIRVEVNEK